jgi:hypothetical protein
MTTAGQPETGPHVASLQLMDQIHPAGSVMAEEVCDRPLVEPWYAFPDDLPSLHRYFLS